MVTKIVDLGLNVDFLIDYNILLYYVLTFKTQKHIVEGKIILI